ncbi:Complex 1 LYR protein [Trypanosoma melophagium]|uniref:Complex 1 LYR protein n=1 Tax=Trypanosoma melophagium TaxID=715481 RepID=UPI00351A70BD|nr:Complex 1 LYR protein [Trypanosoma melophagium]
MIKTTHSSLAMMQRSCVCHSNLRNTALVAPVSSDLIRRAGTDLPGIPHQYRVCRSYRQWLKLAVLCPPSALCELNEHAQMNERFVIIIRQKFREGAELRDPEQIAVAVQSCERSLAMFRFLAADGAKRRFPEAKPRLNLHKMGFLEMAKINYTQMAKEYWNTYVMRRW